MGAADIRPAALRWRVVAGELPLRRRHLRSLEALELPPALLAWVHERLDWAKDNLLSSSTEGVLCLDISPEEIVVSMQEVRGRPQLELADLEASGGQVVAPASAPGTVWLEAEDGLIASAPSRDAALKHAMATLASDLAKTRGYSVQAGPVCASDLAEAKAVFITSDEFGFVPVGDCPEGSIAAEMASHLAKVVP